jgi:hypothetical protein
MKQVERGDDSKVKEGMMLFLKNAYSIQQNTIDHMSVRPLCFLPLNLLLLLMLAFSSSILLNPPFVDPSRHHHHHHHIPFPFKASPPPPPT